MDKGKRAPVLAVLNLKGGVGKTTVSAHVFRVLFSRFKAGTLLVDLDPQFNLTQTLLTRAVYERLKAEDRTIMAVMEPPPVTGLFDIRVTSTPPPDPYDVSYGLWHFKKDPKRRLALVPGDFRLVKYSLMNDTRKLDEVRKRFSHFISNTQDKFHVVCIDCNPSSSFLTSCALHACTHIVVPVRPDKYSILGLELLSEYVEGIPSIVPKPTIVVLLNGVPRQHYNDTIEVELRAHAVFGSQTLASRLYQSNILVAHPDYTGFATDKRVPHKSKLYGEIAAVADELAAAIGLSA